MLRHLRLTILLVTFYLLTSAATAHAECAWVLWGQASGRSWEPHMALATQEECEKVLDESRPHLRGTSLVCFPDTVDPRGVKGK